MGACMLHVPHWVSAEQGIDQNGPWRAKFTGISWRHCRDFTWFPWGGRGNIFLQLKDESLERLWIIPRQFTSSASVYLWRCMHYSFFLWLLFTQVTFAEKDQTNVFTAFEAELEYDEYAQQVHSFLSHVYVWILSLNANTTYLLKKWWESFQNLQILAKDIVSK